MKKFIITIDTEGDNIWTWDGKSAIRTENALYISRFQELCERYGFIPTYLVNWEMAHDDRFVDYIKPKVKERKCEVGMHLHPWNTPPFYDLPRDQTSGLPYLIEYPIDIMEEKINRITQLIELKFELKPLSHRAGRWAMNAEYFSQLYKYGYTTDCSYTPGMSWVRHRGRTPGIGGSDYSGEKNVITRYNGIYEVPLSTMVTHKLFNQAYKDKIDYEQRKRVLWLRPDNKNLKQIKYLIRSRRDSKIDYLEFMLHSSELMPGGSPTFRSINDIEMLYRQLDIIFNEIETYYSGIGLAEYIQEKMTLNNKTYRNNG